MVEIKIRNVSESTKHAIDRIVAEKNINSPKKITRQAFLKEWLDEIPKTYLSQKQDTETSIQLKEQNNLLKENIRMLNVLAAYFVSGDIESAEKGLQLLHKNGDDFFDN